MVDGHLNNDEFFTKLSELFDHKRKKEHGSVFLTQKRLTYSLDSFASIPTKVADDPLWDLHPEHPLPIIIHATDGKGKEHRKDKIKLSTIVQPDALDGFYTRYAEVCKAGMQALKKRDRTKDKAKRKKNKAKKREAGADGEKKG